MVAILLEHGRRHLLKVTYKYHWESDTFDPIGVII